MFLLEFYGLATGGCGSGPHSVSRGVGFYLSDNDTPFQNHTFLCLWMRLNGAMPIVPTDQILPRNASDPEVGYTLLEQRAETSYGGYFQIIGQLHIPIYLRSS